MKLLSRVAQLGDPRWLHFYFQRLFIRPSRRNAIASWIAALRRPDPAEQTSPKTQALADDLADTGLVALPPLLSADQCEELRTFFRGKPVIDHYREEWPDFLPLGAGRHPHCHVAYHRPEDVAAAPYLLEIANHPLIIEVLRRHFGCDPTISYMAAWWSYPTELGPQQAENFHRDVDDWRFVKLFVYLTDVGPDNGPHVYVRASAHQDSLLKIQRFTNEEVHKAFGRQALSVQTGRAGDAFLEDTFGLHKGTPVESGNRLIFQAMYSLMKVPYGPRRPVARFDSRLPDDRRARWMNRVYLQS